MKTKKREGCNTYPSRVISSSSRFRARGPAGTSSWDMALKIASLDDPACKQMASKTALICFRHWFPYTGVMPNIVGGMSGISRNTDPNVPHHLDSHREGSERWSGLPFLFSQLRRGALLRRQLSCSLVHSSVGAFPNLVPNDVILQFISRGAWLEWTLDFFLPEHRLRMQKQEDGDE